MNYQQIPINVRPDSDATLTVYALDNSPEIDCQRQRPAVIICPGGGYEMTSDREGEAIAIKMLGFGFQAFVLRYSVAPAAYPVALLELATAVSLVRGRSQEWHVDPERIIVAGFSAGGHLAANLGVSWQAAFIEEALGGHPSEWQPNGLLLAYPVITGGKYAHQGSMKQLLGQQDPSLLDSFSLETQVSQQTPQTFIWHTVEDDCVPVENSLLFVQALRRQQVSFELHLYPRGGHGLALGTAETRSVHGNGVQEDVASWLDLFASWVNHHV